MIVNDYEDLQHHMQSDVEEDDQSDGEDYDSRVDDRSYSDDGRGDDRSRSVDDGSDFEEDHVRGHGGGGHHHHQHHRGSGGGGYHRAGDDEMIDDDDEDDRMMGGRGGGHGHHGDPPGGRHMSHVGQSEYSGQSQATSTYSGHQGSSPRHAVPLPSVSQYIRGAGNAYGDDMDATSVIQDSVFNPPTIYGLPVGGRCHFCTRFCSKMCCAVSLLLLVLGGGAGVGIAYGVISNRSTEPPPSPAPAPSGTDASTQSGEEVPESGIDLGPVPPRPNYGDTSRGNGTMTGTFPGSDTSEVPDPKQPPEYTFDVLEGPPPNVPESHYKEGDEEGGHDHEAMEDRYAAIRDALTPISGDEAFLDDGKNTSQIKALRWLSYFDPTKPDPDDPNLPVRYALTVFFYETGGPKWYLNSRWLMDPDVCDWYGVTCGNGTTTTMITEDMSDAAPGEGDGKGGRVRARVHSDEPGGGGGGRRRLLRARARARARALDDVPPDEGTDGGVGPYDEGTDNGVGPDESKDEEEPPQQQGKVTVLHLPANNLRGPLPEELSVLEDLTSLSLYYNNVTGPLPEGLGRLTNLRKMILYKNRITGPLPESIGEMISLESVMMDENELSGNLPPSLGRLANLEKLELFANKLTGPIPGELASCTKLKTLWLSNNTLSGTLLPDLFQNLTSLEAVYLEENELDGPLPVGFGSGQAGVLRDVRLNGNSFSGDIPDGWGVFGGGLGMGLEYLYLGDNMLTGPLPFWLFGDGGNGNATALGPRKLRELNLSGNGLSGPLPADLNYLQDLEILVLHNNKFVGALPDLHNCTELVVIELHENSLSGEIPEWMGNLPWLETLRLQGNSFNGSLPDLSGSAMLVNLQLHQNSLSGEFPEWIGSLSLLEILSLGQNGFSGPIPDSLQNLENLRHLRLEENNLVGSIAGGVCSLNISELVVDCDAVSCECCPTCAAGSDGLQDNGRRLG